MGAHHGAVVNQGTPPAWARTPAPNNGHRPPNHVHRVPTKHYLSTNVGAAELGHQPANTNSGNKDTHKRSSARAASARVGTAPRVTARKKKGLYTALSTLHAARRTTQRTHMVDAK